mgnify:FL=1
MPMQRQKHVNGKVARINKLIPQFMRYGDAYDHVKHTIYQGLHAYHKHSMYDPF